MSAALSVAVPTMPLDRAVEKFIALRDRKAQIIERHKAELAPYNDAMGRLEGLLLDALNTAHLDAMKAPAGTFFRKVTTSVTVSSWSETLAYIREHELWDLLEARVSKTMAQQIIEDTDAAIPGVIVRQVAEVQVRRNA